MIKSRKLSLRAETIRVLTGLELQFMAGAMQKTTWIGPGENACSYTHHDQRAPCASVDGCLSNAMC